MSSEIVSMARSGSGQEKASKREKFVQLAEKRTANAIRSIRIIGKLGNRSAYDYSDTDVKKIVKALTDEVETLKSRMTRTGRGDAIDFKL